MKITFTIGISASGKTTWANQFCLDNPDTVNINRDDIRFKTFCNGERNWSKYKFNKSNENRVSEIQETIILGAVVQNKNIIISDTNLNSKTVERILKLPCLKDYKPEYKYFDTDLEKCLKRDALRENGVGCRVIFKQYKDYCKIRHEKNYHKHDNYKIDAYMFDIDGTLADMTGVRSPFEWDKVHLDNPKHEVISALLAAYSNGYHIVIMSGRDSCCEDKTREWLDYWLPQVDYELFMREEGNMQKDTIIKKSLFNNFVNHKYNIHVLYDDRPSVCRMFRYELGLNVIQVGDPYIEF